MKKGCWEQTLLNPLEDPGDPHKVASVRGYGLGANLRDLLGTCAGTTLPQTNTRKLPGLGRLGSIEAKYGSWQVGLKCKTCGPPFNFISHARIELSKNHEQVQRRSVSSGPKTAEQLPEN